MIRALRALWRGREKGRGRDDRGVGVTLWIHINSLIPVNVIINLTSHSHYGL